MAQQQGSMTPIRIKGKKRKMIQETNESVGTQSLQDSGSSARTEEGKVKTTILSSLEKLPVELLEDILIKSLNMDLPLVSRTLLVKLSNRSLFYAMFLGILQDQENAVLHSALFRRRFVSNKLFEQMHRRALLPMAKKGRESKKQRTLSLYWTLHYEPDLDPTSETPFTEKAFFCAPGTQLPLRVLKFTNESWSLYRHLVYAGATIDWENTTTGEAAAKALEKCFASGDYCLASYLLEGGIGLEYNPELLYLALKWYVSEEPPEEECGWNLLNELCYFDEEIAAEAYRDSRLWRIAEEKHSLERITGSADTKGEWILDLLTGRIGIEDILPLIQHPLIKVKQDLSFSKTKVALQAVSFPPFHIATRDVDSGIKKPN